MEGFFALYRRSDDNNETVAEIYGPLRVTSPQGIALDEAETLAKRLPIDASGYLGVLVGALNYRIRPTPRAFADLLRRANHSWNILHSIPSPIFDALCIPVADGETLVACGARIAAMTAPAFAMMLSDTRRGRYSFSVPAAGREIPPKDFGRLISARPWIAFHVLYEDVSAAARYLANPDIKAALARLLIERPRLGRRYFGAIGDVLGGPDDVLLRESLCTMGEDADAFEAAFGWPQMLRPFPLRLPDETPLLRLTTARLITFLSDVRSRQSDIADLATVSRIVRQYLPSDGELAAVVADAGLAPDLRSCAALLAALRDSAANALVEHAELLRLGAQRHSFVAFAAAVVAKILRADASEATKSMLIDILAALPDDDFSRRAWNTLIARWREESRAPVSAAGLLSTWLSVASETCSQ